jgi:hypothetical protein
LHNGPPQPLCFQTLADSFHCNGGVYPLSISRSSAEGAFHKRKISARIAHFFTITPFPATLALLVGGGGGEVSILLTGILSQRLRATRDSATVLLAGPDAGGEGFDGAEAEFFVEADGGFVVGGDGEREFVEFHGAQGINGREHEHAAEAVALVAGQDANLRGVAHAGGDLAGEDRADELVAAGLAQDKRGAWDKLAAAGKQDDVFQKTQRAGTAAILVVDFAVHVIGVGKIDELGAGIEVAVVPAVEAHSGRGGRGRHRKRRQIEEHELAGVEAEAVLLERFVHGAAERHELGFNANELGESVHTEKHLFKQAASDGGLIVLRRNVQAADEAFLLFEDVEAVSGGDAALERDATRKRTGFEEALDKLEGATVVPVKLFAPVARFFIE